MRRLVPFAALLLAACASTPKPEPAKPAAPAPVGDQHDHRTVNGMTAGELIQHFGKPRLQIVEGNGTKLQFAGPNCVMDVYLYADPGKSGPQRATHIEARNLQGGAISAQSCSYAIEGK